METDQANGSDHHNTLSQCYYSSLPLFWRENQQYGTSGRHTATQEASHVAFSVLNTPYFKCRSVRKVSLHGEICKMSKKRDEMERRTLRTLKNTILVTEWKPRYTDNVPANIRTD